MGTRSRTVEFVADQSVGEITFVTCIRCDKNTNHKVLKAIDEVGSADRIFDEYQWTTKHQIIQCQGCETLSFLMINSSSDDPDDYETLLPSRAKKRQLIGDFQLLPPDLRHIYRETVSALDSDQPILSGIGIRAMLETITNQQQAGGSTLEEKIDDLVKKNVLTKDGAEILHKIRTLGNEAAHKVKVHGATELLLAMNVVEHLLQAVYVLPYHAKQTFK